jgi:hypothetical protein
MPAPSKMSPTPVAETYSRILEFFQDQDRFCTGYYQKDKDGNLCKWAEGYSYCALGAICFFTDGMGSHEPQCCLQRVSEYLYDKNIQEVNDGPDGYAKVLVALKFAIELWQGREPTKDELGMAVETLLEKRKAAGQ